MAIPTLQEAGANQRTIDLIADRGTDDQCQVPGMTGLYQCSGDGLGVTDVGKATDCESHLAFDELRRLLRRHNLFSQRCCNSFHRAYSFFMIYVI